MKHLRWLCALLVLAGLYIFVGKDTPTHKREANLQPSADQVQGQVTTQSGLPAPPGQELGDLNQPTTEQTAKETSQKRFLKAMLRSGYGIALTDISARIGLAYVSEEDASELFAEQHQTHKPEDYFDLAMVDQWLETSVTGDGSIGPIEVPSAELYRIVAWQEEGAIFALDYAPLNGEKGELDAGHINRIRPTGLRIKPDPAITHKGYHLRMSRIVKESLPHRDPLADILPLGFPEVYRAYDGETIPLETPLRLAPLYPDEVVQLQVIAPDGTPAPPLRIPLERERIKEIILDKEKLPNPETTQGLVFEGLLRFPHRPDLPDGTIIERLGARFQRLHVGVDGFFRFENVPTQTETRFRVRIPSTHSTRPEAPEDSYFNLMPTPEERDLKLAKREWVLPTFRWLVVNIDKNQRATLEKNTPRGYPVYVLEEEIDGDIQTIGSDYFLQEENGMAVALVKEGIFRVKIALSPVYFLTTQWVRSEQTDAEVFIPSPTLSSPDIPEYTLSAKDVQQNPLAATQFWLVGEHGSLPPIRLTTNRQGLVALGKINVPIIFVSAGDTEHKVTIADLPSPHLQLTFPAPQ